MRPAAGSAIPRRSGWTMGRSSSPATSICGPTCMAWCSTSPDQQAHGQCIHRSLQWTLSGGVPERPPVPDPCGRGRKVGGLAQILQRGSACRREEAGKLQPPAVQRRGSDQNRPKSMGARHEVARQSATWATWPARRFTSSAVPAGAGSRKVG